MIVWGGYRRLVVAVGSENNHFRHLGASSDVRGGLLFVPGASAGSNSRAVPYKPCPAAGAAHLELEKWYLAVIPLKWEYKRSLAERCAGR